MIFSTNFENRVTANTITQDQANKIKAVINKNKDECVKKTNTKKTNTLTLNNIKIFIKMARNKIKWRKKLKIVPELKKWDFKKSTVVLTRSALHDLLFNKAHLKII